MGKKESLDLKEKAVKLVHEDYLVPLELLEGEDAQEQEDQQDRLVL